MDEVASRTVIEQQLIKTFGWDAKSKDFNYTSFYDYALTDPQPDNNQIAVIFANGMIVDGNEAPGYVGGNTTAGQIRDARLDPKVKAIILRVNSPGGSVTASEQIRAELAAARQAGKPVVVSMGGMAASGGYWISTPANAIVASPSTLTGSIGIFGVVNTVENTLDSVGVHTDGVATSPLADLSMTKALPPEFGQLMQVNIERGYKNFLSLVAKSRNKTPEQVDEIAQGHVWIGSDAKANGLVDTLGDFDDAVKKAAELAKLDHHQLVWFEEDEGVMDVLFNQVRSSVYATLPDALQTLFPAPVAELSEMLRAQPSLSTKLTDPQHRYVICLSCGNVR